MAERTGVERWTTNLDEALADPGNQIFFDASSPFIGPVRGDGGQSNKAIYCEKPTAVTTEEALRLAKLCEDAGVKNGAVQDKLWLPGIRKLKTLIKQGFFGEILSVRGSSDTGCSPDMKRISLLSVQVGTTARRMAAASS